MILYLNSYHSRKDWGALPGSTPSIPTNYAVPKEEFINRKRKLIEDMQLKIAQYEQEMLKAKKGSPAYEEAVKRIAVCQRIITSSEDSIRNTQHQLDLAAATKAARYKEYKDKYQRVR